MPLKIQNHWYTHPLSLNLYGLNMTKNNISKTKKAIIFEGEKSVMLMDTYYPFNNSVAVCGSTFNKSQLNLLLKYCEVDEIIIAFDKEFQRVDSLKAEQYYNKLSKICHKYENYCNFSFIFDKWNLLNEKDSPIDRGQQIFERLFLERIKVVNR